LSYDQTQPSRTRGRIALAVVVVLAAVAWLVAFPAYKWHRAMQETERVGGEVQTETVGPEWLSQWGVGFNRVYWVYLAGTEISDDGLEHFSALANLRYLHLNNTEISDNGLKHLKSLTSLHFLLLNGTHVSDYALKHLSNLTSLRGLHLDDTRITDEGLKNFSGLTNPDYLILENTQDTGDGLKILQESLANCDIVH
jgi:hypothetical protein